MRFAKLVTLAAVCLIAAGCAGQQPATTPTVDDTDGRFVWQDLMTEDVDTAIDFYGGLFGWEFEETTRLGQRYVLVRADGVYVGGISAVEDDDPDQSIDQWLSYLAVADVDAALDRARNAGGEVLVDPVDLTSSRAAIVTDEQGAPLGLAQFTTALTPEAQQALDARVFIWRDYLARDVADAVDFYRDVAGFEAERSNRQDSVEHYVLSRGEPRAGLFAIGDEEVEPNWLVYVRVDDPAAAAARAEQLGGTVLLAPTAELRSGSLAIVADPGGAAIALQQWPINASEDR